MKTTAAYNTLGDYANFKTALSLEICRALAPYQRPVRVVPEALQKLINEVETSLNISELAKLWEDLDQRLRAFSWAEKLWGDHGPLIKGLRSQLEKYPLKCLLEADLSEMALRNVYLKDDLKTEKENALKEQTELRAKLGQCVINNQKLQDEKEELEKQKATLAQEKQQGIDEKKLVLEEKNQLADRITQFEEQEKILNDLLSAKGLPNDWPEDYVAVKAENAKIKEENRKNKELIESFIKKNDHLQAQILSLEATIIAKESLAKTALEDTQRQIAENKQQAEDRHEQLVKQIAELSNKTNATASAQPAQIPVPEIINNVAVGTPQPLYPRYVKSSIFTPPSGPVVTDRKNGQHSYNERTINCTR
jgi:DNA repair exonuclease SbcCD ATPase subunit